MGSQEKTCEPIGLSNSRYPRYGGGVKATVEEPRAMGASAQEKRYIFALCNLQVLYLFPFHPLFSA